MPMNFAKTGLLLAVLTGILVAMGGLIGGATGMVIALAVAAAMNLFSPGSPTRWCSGGTAPGSRRPVGRRLHRIVRDLAAPRRAADAARLCHEQPAAQRLVATGRNPANAAVCASTGLLECLSAEEVRAWWRTSWRT